MQSRNKKSLTLNLRSAEGQEIVRKLVQDADIVIENFRPGALEKWNIGWEQLSAINPRLIMVRLSGYGQTGPDRDKPGFGVIGESMGGLRYVTGYADRPPVRLGVSIGDSIAALYGVIGAMMALQHRHASGRGQMVDVALYEAVFAMMESLVLSDAGRQVCHHWCQQRRDFQTPDERDGAQRSCRRCATRHQRRPRAAHRRDRCRHWRVDGGA